MQLLGKQVIVIVSNAINVKSMNQFISEQYSYNADATFLKRKVFVSKITHGPHLSGLLQKHTVGFVE